MPKRIQIKGAEYIHIAEAIEVEARDLDSIRSFPYALDKIKLVEAKALIAGAVWDLFVGEINSARIRMYKALDCLECIIYDAKDEYFIDVMQAIEHACYRKLLEPYVDELEFCDYD